MTIFEKYKVIQELSPKIKAPWEAFRVTNLKTIEVFGDQIALGNEGDFVSLEEARKALEFYVTELGGEIKWKK